MKRRTFLQRIGSVLATLGITEAGWLTLGNRYYQALAVPSPRKFALLVGINQYSPNPNLAGCLTDVDLQRELLIHRFGFQPSDILSLTDEQGTREFIERAFLDHLVKQVRPDDVVIFHFSGYGSRIQGENALVPVNNIHAPEDDKIVNYLLLDTLQLLLRSLPTNRVIAVLDTSYYVPNTLLPAASTIRTLQVPQDAKIAPEELEQRKQLKEKSFTKDAVVVLSATSDSQQLAREVQFSGVSAGIFTYALTQYLWSAIPAKTINISLTSVADSMKVLGNKQQPGLLIDQKNQLSAKFSEKFFQESTVGVQGVVNRIDEDGKIARLWLAGVPLHLLEYYGVSSRFSLVGEDKSNAQLVLQKRNGLTAKAQLSDPSGSISLHVGQLIQETVRVLPRNISIIVALDSGLERIERVDATSSFATSSHISSVIAGEQSADYVFGKLNEAQNKNSTGNHRYGLFSLGGELISNTLGEPGEAVKLAAKRLTLKLQTLLAAKLWRLTENEASSGLAVKANLEIVNSLTSRVIRQQETTRTADAVSLGKNLSGNQMGQTTTVPVGSRVQYRVENKSDRPIYLMLFGLDSSKNALALYRWRNQTDTSAKPTLLDAIIAPGETRIVPQTVAGFEWVVQGPSCLCQTQLIFSTAPFTQTLNALQSVKYPGTELQRISPLTNPLEAAQAVLQDLHDASVVSEGNSASGDNYLFHVNNWASLSFIYQVV